MSLDDDGDYWTWTRAEAAAALTAEEMRVAGPWFHIGEIGDMHHNAEKNVLHLELPLGEVARAGGGERGRGGGAGAKREGEVAGGSCGSGLRPMWTGQCMWGGTR